MDYTSFISHLLLIFFLLLLEAVITDTEATVETWSKE